jgi:hypothetical protein
MEYEIDWTHIFVMDALEKRNFFESTRGTKKNSVLVQSAADSV